MQQQEIADLHKEIFVYKLRMVSKLLIRFKQESRMDQEEAQIERNRIFLEKVRQIVMGSENSRLLAMVSLRKDMMKDYKEKYEKSAHDLY